MARGFGKLIEPVSSQKTSIYLYMNGDLGVSKVKESPQFSPYLKAFRPTVTATLGRGFYPQPEENEHSS